MVFYRDSLDRSTSAFSETQTTQALDLQQALGPWRSAEQFEGEPRLSFAFRQQGNEITGWAVLLGQQRKTDRRATLALTFHGVVWDRDRLKFETMLPEDEGTIGWELRVTAPNKAELKAVTEDGSPLADELSWQMSKQRGRLRQPEKALNPAEQRPRG